MTAVGFDKDPTQLILAQLRKNDNSAAGHQQLYFQVDYAQKQIVRVNPQQLIHYQRPLEEQNLRQYFEECSKDKGRFLNFKHELKTRYFHISEKKPKTFEDTPFSKQPLEMIKSYSQSNRAFKKDRIHSSFRQSSLAKSHISTKKIVDPKSRYSDEFQNFLDSSERLTHKKSKYRLRGGTIRQKQKQAEKIMNEQKGQILDLVKYKDYNLHRPDSINELPNKQKYGLNFIDYMRLKTKNNIEKQLYEKKVRRPNSKLENFQEFIIEEGKFKGKAKEKLSDYYIKIREEFRRNLRNAQPTPRTNQ